MPLLKLEQLSGNETPEEYIQRIQKFYEYVIVNFEGR